MTSLNGRVARSEAVVHTAQPEPPIPSPDVEAAMERNIARAKALILLSGGREVYDDIKELLVDERAELIEQDSEILQGWREEHPEHYVWTGGGEDPGELLIRRIERRIQKLRLKEREG